MAIVISVGGLAALIAVIPASAPAAAAVVSALGSYGIPVVIEDIDKQAVLATADSMWYPAFGVATVCIVALVMFVTLNKWASRTRYQSLI